MFANLMKRVYLNFKLGFLNSKILVNNIYSQKSKLHFDLLNLHFEFYLSTIYKSYFIFVYKNCFSCQTTKTTYPIFLVRIFISTFKH